MQERCSLLYILILLMIHVFNIPRKVAAYTSIAHKIGYFRRERLYPQSLSFSLFIRSTSDVSSLSHSKEGIMSDFSQPLNGSSSSNHPLLINPTQEGIAEAAKYIRNGGLVAFPTEVLTITIHYNKLDSSNNFKI